jgi:hypothetical protein
MATTRERALQSVTRGGRPMRRARRTGHHVVVSPRPMAHLADAQDSLHPICVHGSEGGTGWTASADPWGTWATVHPDIPRCLTCISISG